MGQLPGLATGILAVGATRNIHLRDRVSLHATEALLLTTSLLGLDAATASLLHQKVFFLLLLPFYSKTNTPG